MFYRLFWFMAVKKVWRVGWREVLEHGDAAELPPTRISSSTFASLPFPNVLTPPTPLVLGTLKLGV